MSSSCIRQPASSTDVAGSAAPARWSRDRAGRDTRVRPAGDLAARLVAIFTTGPDGRRPVFGPETLFQTDPRWHDLVPFHEYFHGDTGRGLGAAHQTGWTALVADLILRKGADR
ncbi:MAG TPA: hypothetical protein VI248_26280 [Kineosporiaceae bacterium]